MKLPLAIAVAASALAENLPAQAILAGQVVNSSGRALSGALVGIRDLGASTDSRGAFRLSGIAAGAHEVTVRYVGYAPVTRTLTLGASDSVFQVFTLTRIVALDTVLTRATSSRIPGFDERRQRGGGRFLTREDLEKEEGRKLSDVLRRVSGVRIIPHPKKPGEAYAINSRGTITMLGSNPKCYVHMYIDDAAVVNEEHMPFNLAALSAHEIEAVEYYGGGASIPAKYNRTGAACGVLLIWTRR